ncbi:MAG: RHS repeat-associated core domain-containing protein [Isosphaeraceae bacterium]
MTTDALPSLARRVGIGAVHNAACDGRALCGNSGVRASFRGSNNDEPTPNCLPGSNNDEPTPNCLDQVSAVVLVKDDLGHRVWSARIDPYGLAHIDPSSRIDVPLRFPGHYADPEIGLYYNRFRFYSPELGRYTQSDPVGIGAGLNVYAYPASPLAQADVRGECPPGDPPEGKGEEEDKAGQQQTGKPGVVHRVGGGDEKNLGLKPAEAKLNPPGISVLIGGMPADTAADFRRVFGPRSSLGRLASTVGTAEIEQIRKAGFDVIPVPTKNFPNHGRIIHPTQGAAGFTAENLQKLSPVFTNTTGL